MIEWKEFADEMPAIGKRIIYGNSRGLATCTVGESFESMIVKSEKIMFMPVTHWAYWNDFPPYPKGYVSPWSKSEEGEKNG